MKYLLPKITSLRLLTQLVAGYIAYYVLLTENSTGCSISHIIHFANNQPIKQHLLIMGILPIYIGIIIFGAAMLGNIFGKWLEEYFNSPTKEKSAKSSYTSQI